MTDPRRHCRIAAFLLVAIASALAGDVKIIANPSIKTASISAAELRSLFLLQRRTLRDGSAAQPVLQKAGSSTDTFMTRYLNRDSEEVRIYYQGLVFTGKASMPKMLSSDAEVVAYVARNEGAIGYVSSEANTDAVKVLAVAQDAGLGRTLLTRIEPDYPETLKRMGIGGSVRLELTVSAKGAVEGVAVRGGNPILAEAAVEAAKRWIYSPASTSTKIEVVIPFEPNR